METIRKAMNERNLNESQRDYRKQWILSVGKRRKHLKHIYIYLPNVWGSERFFKCWYIIKKAQRERNKYPCDGDM
jgi:hypothetical protein